MSQTPPENFPTFTELDLEESRTRLGIPADWFWSYCSGPDCTSVVWLPPVVKDAIGDTTGKAVCSETCVARMLVDEPDAYQEAVVDFRTFDIRGDNG